LYRHIGPGIGPARLRLYLNGIYETRAVPGAVVEIGCNVGGTAMIGRRLVLQVSPQRDYYCFDTFAGFVPEQFEQDVRLGNVLPKKQSFAANDISLVKKILKLHNAEDIKLVKGDIMTINEQLIPDPISFCLLDVDLYEPTLAALEKIYSRLSPSGMILVDDCLTDKQDGWQARKAYSEFTQQMGLPERIEFRMGIIVRERSEFDAAG
jgi:hypothetical protein